MIFVLVSIVVPILCVALLPRLLELMTSKKCKTTWTLILASLLFFVSWYVPSPAIDGRNTAFMTHLIGGGIFSGLLWLYAKNQLNISIGWLKELGVLFCIVSALGVSNELAELFFVRTGLASISLEDTSWDLLANTLGAAIVYVTSKIASLLKRVAS